MDKSGNQLDQTGFYLSFISYGVTIKLISNSKIVLNELRELLFKTFPNELHFSNQTENPDHTFIIDQDELSNLSLVKNNDEAVTGYSTDTILELFVRMVRLAVSEDAKDKVFLHSGVVAVNNKIILFPGSSNTGKSSLVLELIKKGAHYYSDEYAVIDTDGLVHPFTRDLSIREEGKMWSEKNGISPNDLGAKIGNKPLPIGYVIFTTYDANTQTFFEENTLGQGILNAIPHTITFSKRPDFSLKVLKTAFSRAIILCGLRSEAESVSNLILSLK